MKLPWGLILEESTPAVQLRVRAADPKSNPGERKGGSLSLEKQEFDDQLCSPRRGGRSPSPGKRPGDREHNKLVPGRSNGPTIRHEFGERMARWADLARRCPLSQGVALGWVNRRAFGPRIYVRPRHTECAYYFRPATTHGVCLLLYGCHSGRAAGWPMGRTSRMRTVG